MKRFFLILLLGASVVLTICCSKKSKSTNPTTKDPDFAIEVSPKTQWVMAGDSTEFQIKLTSLNGFSAPCTLNAVGFPEADSVIFDSEVLVPPDSLQLKINATFSTPRETYKLVITGKNGKLSHTDTVALMVPSEKVTDYYPLAIGNSWSYAFLDDNYQIKTTFTYTVIDTVTINGNFVYLFSREDSLYVYVKGDTILSKSGRIILPGPLVVGQSWTADPYDYELIGFGATTLINEGTKYENCLKIRRTDPHFPGDETFEWWAKGVGKVNVEEYISGHYAAGMELVSFTHP
jgi:hypothetical protein